MSVEAGLSGEVQAWAIPEGPCMTTDKIEDKAWIDPCVIRLPVPVYGHAPRLAHDLEVDMRVWCCMRNGDVLA